MSDYDSNYTQENIFDLKTGQRMRKAELIRDDSPKVDTPENIIRKAVERKYPRLSYEESRKAVNDLVTKPADSKIKIGSEEIRIDDLNIWVADSIEAINSGSSEYGASSVGEYFGWIERGKKVIKDMNDGEITQDDLNEKHGLLNDFRQREVDLMTCVALYQRCNLEKPEVKKKYDELLRKLIKLREIRSAVENSTRDEVDKEKRPEAELARQYARSLLYFKALDLLYEEVKSGRPVISDEDKRKLGIYYEPYVNSVYILNSVSRSSQREDYYRESLAEKFVMKKNEGRSEDKLSISQKLAMLSGRIMPLNNNEAKGNSVEQNKRAFDINTYIMIKKMRENQEYMRA